MVNKTDIIPRTSSRNIAAYRKQHLITLLKLCISVGLIFWILRSTNLQNTFASIRSANMVLVLLAGSLHLVGFTISAFRWQLLLDAQGTDAKIPFLVKSYVVGMFFNNFLPSTMGGDAVRAYDSWRLGGSKSGAVAVVFIDRFLGLLALMVFALIAVLFADYLSADVPYLGLWVSLGLAGMLVVVWLIFSPPAWAIAAMTQANFPFRERIERIITSLVVFQGRRAVLWSALGLSLLLQANVVLHYYIIAQALALTVPLTAFFLIIPLVTILLMVPISINAIGLRENAYVYFLGALAVGRSEALAFAWIA